LTRKVDQIDLVFGVPSVVQPYFNAVSRHILDLYRVNVDNELNTRAVVHEVRCR